MLRKLLTATLLATTITAAAQKPVILDTDIGDDIDDAFALALILRSPELKLLGVVTAFGDTTLRAHQAARMLASAGRSDIPIGIGVPTPTKTKFTQAEFGRADKHIIKPIDGVDMLLNAARQQPGKVTLIAIGPLINIGAAIDRDPASFRKFKEVIVMGGSIHHGYGTHAAEPEWNTRNSPAETRKLLASGVPVYLFPLDSTQIVLPKDIENQLYASTDPLNKDLAEVLHEGKRPRFTLFDPVTISAPINSAICPTKPMHISVDDKGMTTATEGKPNAQVCLASNEAAFLKELDARLLGKRN